MTDPLTIEQSEHGVDLHDLSPQAVEVVQVLNNNGFSGELVGGCVRDLLLGEKPKDFDVATDATPEQVRNLFQRSAIIGRRFRLVEVRLGREVVQVATYRAAPGMSRQRNRRKNISPKGKILTDNNFGDIEQDAFRRDLTINSLYLRPSDMSILDYTGGYEDLQSGIVRVIGDPASRYQEDPVRILRAIRFSASLDFQLDFESAEPIPYQSELLRDVSNARLTEEVKKLFFTGNASSTFGLLNEYGVFTELFPCYSIKFGYTIDETTLQWLAALFQETDNRVQSMEPLSLPYTMAAILWPPYRQAIARQRERRNNRKFDPKRIGRDVLNQQNRSIYMTKVHKRQVEEIWQMQKRLEKEKPGNKSIVQDKRFRAAVRLLELRCRFGEVSKHVTDRWKKIRDGQTIYRKRSRRNKPRNQRMIRA